jgi:hypothetical protein
MNGYKRLLYLVLLLNYTTSKAQSSYDSSLNKALSVYATTAGVNSHLYNGSQYQDYDHRITGNPFFGASYFDPGTIVYDGIQYPQTEMFYDILHDDVVIKNYSDMQLVLVKEKVSSFDYLGHHFIHLFTDSSTTGVRPGFYDELAAGNTRLLAKRKKVIVEKIGLQSYESYYEEQNEYYVFKDGAYFPVKDKRSLMRVLRDKKKELTKYMHEEKIKFRKNTENAMIKLVTYYNGLNTAK